MRLREDLAELRHPQAEWALTLRQLCALDLVMFLVGPPPLGPTPALPLQLSRCKKKKDRFLDNAYFDPMLKEMTSSAAFRCVQAWPGEARVGG